MDIVNYEHVPIKRIGKVITGKTPATSHEEYYGGQYMFISPVELHGGYRVTKSEKTITEKGLESIKTNSIEGISILVGCIGWDMGNVAMCFEKCATNQQINAITQIDAKYNPYYIYYWLCGKKKYLFSIASVTRTPILSKSTFEEIVIPLPIKKNQDKIANILLKIDQKITLNKQINDNLQQQAILLYDYWFTQFDFPDANGKPYYSSGNKMTWNNQLKKNIPLSWKVKPLKAICEICLGGTPSTTVSKYWNGSISWLNSGEIAQFPVVSSEKKITQLGLENSPTKLMSKNTTVISITGNIRASILALDACANQSVVGILENEIFKSPFIYQNMLRLLKHYTSISTGNCQKHISKGAIEESLVCIPDNIVLKQYYSLSEPIYKQMHEIALENQHLTELRDWLLPMLMNGQVTIKD